MRPGIGVEWILIAASAIVTASAGTASGALPPGRPYVLTIKGENTVTFLPETGLAPLPIDYKASIEYLVNTRDIEPGSTNEATAGKKARRRGTRGTGRDPQRADDDDAPRPAGAVDLAVHSAEMTLRRNAQIIVQSRVNRARFQGRLLPDAPVLSVSYFQAPPALQELLQRFDTPAASIVLDDQANVLARRDRFEGGPFHAIVETLLSIHTPIPKDVASWEAPTQLAMGHGQTAKGSLRFEKEKASVAASGGLVNVKVSGVLKAEGVIVGNLIKDGTYTVTGEQSYDPHTREWKSARWSVAIETELANQGATVAHTRGKMLVESRALDHPPAARDPASGKRRAGGTASPGATGAPG
jgi:hypothetical protein